MKTLKPILLLVLVLSFCLSGNAGTYSEIKKGDQTTVYYFHNTRRCPTCIAIEKEAKKVLEDSFSEEVENGTIKFEAYNAEEESNKELVKKLNVTGSALIIVKEGEKFDLTSKGFMYALKQPEKLRKALWEILID